MCIRDRDWVTRALSFLVISCPCALVISVPLGFFGGIGGASRAGVLVKGSNYLEAMAKTEIVVFDKTGTLTKGTFSVTDIQPSGGMSSEALLDLSLIHIYAVSCRKQQDEQDSVRGRRVIQRHGNLILVQNPPMPPLTQEELDPVYALPYERTYHPCYESQGGVPAILSLIHI